MVRLEKHGRVAVLVLDNPPANIFNYAGLQRLAALVDKARFDEDVRAVVVASALPTFFSVGADLKLFRASTPRQRAMVALLGHEVFRKIEHTPLMFIASIAGHAIGGGLELAMACDVRFAAEGDYTLGLTEVKLGLFPGMGGTQRLTRLVGLSRGLDMIATARTMTPADALKLGVIDRVLPGADTCLSAAMDYAAAIANGPSEAVGRAKIAMSQGYGAPLDLGLALEREGIARVFASRDAEEGVAAFAEKRSAVFQGR